jgi:hypothetical protein
MVRGSVDLVTVNEVHGWAYAGDRKGPVLVQAVLHHEIIGETAATIHRPDLAQAGLGDGNSGFIIGLFRPLDPIYLPFVAVKVNGGDAELPRGPELGFGDFFKTLYKTYPLCGRHRSLLGGLWTDRTDAGAVLRGKLTVGHILPAVVPAVQALIHDGYAVIGVPAIPAEGQFRDAKAEAIAEVMDDAGLLVPLQAILEDQPLVLRTEFLSTETGFSQPSARNGSLSPAESLELLIPFGTGASVDVVRDGHKLPEYTLDGRSRWVTGGLAEAGGNAWLDRLVLSPGEVMVMGAGTIYRAGVVPGAAVLRLTVAPGRNLAAGVLESGAVEHVAKSGVRIVI